MEDQQELNTDPDTMTLEELRYELKYINSMIEAAKEEINCLLDEEEKLTDYALRRAVRIYNLLKNI